MIREDSFMQPQVTAKSDWWEIDGTRGIEVFPAEYFGHDEAVNNYSGEVWKVNLVSGYGARLSAPGYMDATGWAVYDSPDEAMAELDAMYGDD